ncbi:MAG: ABC transporter ATP-binding protein [Candidatus Omnitrophica bacterium]|nr:ABC transporter ATP-binding protein [Candidatus Omnitrophota bacterium]
MNVIRFIKEILNKYPKLLILNTVIVVLIGFFGLGSLFAVGPLIDLFLHPDMKGLSDITLKGCKLLSNFNIPATFSSWVIIFLVLTIVSGFLQLIGRYIVQLIKFEILKDMIKGTFEDFFNARWLFFSTSKEGTLLNTFRREMPIVGDAFGAISTFFSEAIRIALLLFAPFYISWQVASVSVTAAFVFIIPFIMAGKINYIWGKADTSANNKLTSIINENFILSKLIIGFANQKKAIESFLNAFHVQRKYAIRVHMLNASIPILYRPFIVIMVVIALYSARKFAVPLSDFTVLILSLMQIALSIANIASQKNVLDNFYPSYEQMKELRKKSAEMKQVSGDRIFTCLKEGITVKDLSFAYPNNPPVLQDINIIIPKGKTAAFVGKSGYGKSTIIDIILGFHEPGKGCVEYDNINLKDYDISSIRKRIGYVPQNTVLFNTSIRENLLWAYPEAAEEELLRVCKLCHVDEFIKNMPDGIETIVGDRGTRLSGGQMQRISLARALLRKPDILILDEATSALDSHSEAMIQDAINNLSKNFTMILVAHRLSTVQNADKIYVLERGRIVESGTHDELMALKGQYRAYYDIQSKAIADI